MAINNPTFRDMDKDKFVESSSRSGLPSVEVTIGNPADISGVDAFLAVTNYDTVDITYPLSTQEVYDYKLLTVSVRTVTIDYIDSTKEKILKVVYS